MEFQEELEIESESKIFFKKHLIKREIFNDYLEDFEELILNIENHEISKNIRFYQKMINLTYFFGVISLIVLPSPLVLTFSLKFLISKLSELNGFTKYESFIYDLTKFSLFFFIIGYICNEFLNYSWVL